MRRFLLMNMLVAVAFLFTSGPALAGQVTRIYKKRSIVKINEGSSAGVAKGAKVCFFSPAGKKVACGKVRKATSSAAFVRVNKKRLRRIKKGFEATASGAGEGGETISGSGEQVVTVDGGIDHRTNIKLGYIFSAVTPAKYNKLTYNAPVDQSEAVNTLWAEEGATTTTPIGLLAEGEFGIGESMALSFGLRYRLFRDFVATSDYNKETSQLSKFVEIEQTSSAIGLYSDLTFLDIAFSPSFFYRMSSGLDIDQSSVKLSAKQKNDEGTENASIASYKSSLTVVSLRLGLNFNFLIAGPLGMALGLNALVPVTTFGKSASANVSDPQAESNFTGGSAKANEDLVNAVAHDKNSFGAEIFFTTYFAF